MRHVPVDPSLITPNGKVGGVLTGARLARADALVIADDDVRYDGASLRAIEVALRRYDVVRPQNFFCMSTWPARWETARILLNRSLGQDFPGTLGVRRGVLTEIAGYDGDVLFENLELLRTAHVAGARVAGLPDLLVPRLPPVPGGLSRRQVRYAYESFAQPGRMAVELCLAPTFGVLLVKRRRLLIAAAGAAMVTAERGRRRGRGREVFPIGAVILAPGWLLARGVCSWIAVWIRARHGGLSYANTRIRVAANSEHSLRRRRRAQERPRGT